MHLSLSVKDTNKLREKLGLKLIPTDEKEDPNTSDSRLKSNSIEAKLSEAAERVESRDLHAKAVANEFLSTTSKTESTDSWLDKIIKLKETSGSANSKQTSPGASQDIPEQVRSAPDQTHLFEKSSHNNTQESTISNDSSIVPTQNTDTSPKEESQPKPLKRPYADPLEAPSEALEARNEAPPKKAVFKHKKVKSNAKSRAREVSTPVLPTRTEQDEEEDLDKVLSRSRIAHKNDTNHNENPKEDTGNSFAGPQIFCNDSTSDGLVIDSTSSLLTSLKNNATSDTESETRNHVISDMKNDSGGEEQDIEAQDDNSPNDFSTTTKLSSVADVLKQVHTAQESPLKPTITSKSKEWARNLAKKRKERELELLEAEKMYKNLPANEREEAIKLHKQRIAQEQVSEARELAANYAPSVEIEHKDEEGHNLDTRGAFKKLSREFHQNRQKNN